MRHAELKPELPASMFPVSHSPIYREAPSHSSNTNISYEEISKGSTNTRNFSKIDNGRANEFMEDEIDDEDFLEVGIVAFFVEVLVESAHII